MRKKAEKWVHPMERVDMQKVKLPKPPMRKGQKLKDYVKKERINTRKRRKQATKTGKSEKNPPLVMDLKKADRLRNGELDALKSKFQQQKFSLAWINKMRLTPVTMMVMALYKHVHDLIPLRVLKNAPFITPSEAHKVLVEVGLLSGYKHTDKQAITQAIKALAREGYIVHVPMLGDIRSKPYHMPTHSTLEKFFE